MINKIPGWLNYFLLWAFYLGIMFGLKWLTKAECDPWFLFLVTSAYAGGYLAKWRFSNGAWRFW